MNIVGVLHRVDIAGVLQSKYCRGAYYRVNIAVKDVTGVLKMQNFYCRGAYVELDGAMDYRPSLLF